MNFLKMRSALVQRNLRDNECTRNGDLIFAYQLAAY